MPGLTEVLSQFIANILNIESVDLVDRVTLVDTLTTITNTVATQDLWRVALQSEETANDSDKTFIVPAATEWQILWIWVEFTSTATVGDRQLVIEVHDAAADVIGQPFRAQAVQAASLTRYYQFGASLPDLDDFRDTDWLCCPIPPGLMLQAGDQLRIYDNAAVDVAADDLILQVQIASRGV